MTRAALLLVLLILIGQTAAAQTAITREQSIFTIDIKENGSAFWQEEKFYPLASKSAISEWNMSLKDEANLTKKKSLEINERINRSVLAAENYSGRPMKVRNFNISYDLVDSLPNAYGIIRLNFEWVNFSKINDSNIIIGEAFYEGVAPSSDNVLVIRIPSGYEVVNASPPFDKQDGNRLIWDGTMYRSFAKGEPYLKLARKPAESMDLFMPELLVFVILIGGGLILFVRSVGKKVPIGQETPMASVEKDKMENVVQPASPVEPALSVQETKPREDELKVADVPPDTALQADMTHQEPPLHSAADLPPLNEEILGDEEMIERYLAKFGGQAYQSDIVAESGLSKSKISIVLAKMKDEGRIIKIRKGKENIIRLARNNV